MEAPTVVAISAMVVTIMTMVTTMSNLTTHVGGLGASSLIPTVTVMNLEVEAEAGVVNALRRLLDPR